MNGLIPYDPQTELGAGLLPLLVRAMSRIITLSLAHRLAWPMTIEQATAELTDTTTALDLQFWRSADVLSTSAKEHLQTWSANVAELAATAATATTANPDGDLAPITEDLKELARRTFAIASILDTDLVGLNGTQTDPGRTP